MTVFGKELQHQLACNAEWMQHTWRCSKCPCCFMHLTLIPCKNIVHKSSLFFLPDLALEYDSLYLIMRGFLNLTQYRNRIPSVLWKDGQSGLYSLEFHCNFLEVVELKMHHVQHDFIPFLAWQVFLSGPFLPSHAYYFTMIVFNFLLGSSLRVQWWHKNTYKLIFIISK